MTNSWFANALAAERRMIYGETPAGKREERYEVHAAAYAKGMLLVRCPSDGTGLKTRAARLIGDGLRCRYTHREGGYIASPAKVEKFKRLFAAGWDASVLTGQLEPPDEES